MSEVENLKCSNCGKECKNKKGLSKHQFHCDISRVDENRCSFCNKEFSSSANLQRHLIICKDAKAYDSAQYNPPSGWLWDPSDLNAGAGGKYIYLVWKTGESKPPIRNITFVVGNQSSPPYIPGWVSIPQDLNQGAGEDYIWLYYTTGQQ
jgi:hypothetical protein